MEKSIRMLSKFYEPMEDNYLVTGSKKEVQNGR